MVEAANVVTTTVETKEEVQVVLAEDVMVKEVRVQEAEVSGQEASVEKLDSKVQHHEENQVLSNAKRENLVAQKAVQIDQQAVRLTLLKTEGQEEVNSQMINNKTLINKLVRVFLFILLIFL